MHFLKRFHFMSNHVMKLIKPPTSLGPAFQLQFHKDLICCQQLTQEGAASSVHCRHICCVCEWVNLITELLKRLEFLVNLQGEPPLRDCESLCYVM